MDRRDQDVITLTHVCRAWRGVLVSCPSLWTNLGCMDLDKTRVYLDRSKSSPISLSLTEGRLHSPYPFFEFIPGVTGRLKSLKINVMKKYLGHISSYLSRPAPLLERLSINAGRNPVLPPDIFNGDLSSLRELHLEHVRTELHWRNMVNLTSFKLTQTSPMAISVRQYLDFFESAPHLREVDLCSSTPFSGPQNGRLVSLRHLKTMSTRGQPSSLLFDHLLIPVGTRLKMVVDLPDLPIEGRPLKFIDNLRNFSNFRKIRLEHGPASIEFIGPNGRVWLVLQAGRTCSPLGSLIHFDTAKTERLEIKLDESPSSDPLYRALLPMKELRILTLTRCKSPHIPIHALHPRTWSSGMMACSKLEELVIVYLGRFDIKKVAETAAARAERGAKLKTVRIVGLSEAAWSQFGISQLEKHVSHVDFGANDDSGEEG